MKKHLSLLTIIILFASAVSAMSLPDKFGMPANNTERIYYYAISADSKTLAIRMGDSIQLWNIANQTLIKTLPTQQPPNSNALASVIYRNTRLLRFTPDGKNLIEFLDTKPNIVVTNINSGKIVFQKESICRFCTSINIAFSESGDQLLVYNELLKNVEIVNTKTWQTLSTTLLCARQKCDEGDFRYTEFSILDSATFLVQYCKSYYECDLIKYKMGTTIGEGETINHVYRRCEIMTRISSEKFSCYINHAWDGNAFYYDIAKNEFTKFYENVFDSLRTLRSGIDVFDYDSNNKILLIGSENPAPTPFGGPNDLLHLIKVITNEISPPFASDYMEQVKLFTNGKEHYVVGIKQIGKSQTNQFIQFMKINEHL